MQIIGDAGRYGSEPESVARMLRGMYVELIPLKIAKNFRKLVCGVKIRKTGLFSLPCLPAVEFHLHVVMLLCLFSSWCAVYNSALIDVA